MLRERLRAQAQEIKTLKKTLEEERRKATSELKNTRYFYENILASMPGHVYWLNKDNVYLGCNDIQADYIGLDDRTEIVGLTNLDMPWAPAASVADDHNFFAMKRGEEITVEEESWMKHHGKKEIFLSKKVPLKNPDGEVIGILGVSFDITEKKEMERELRFANQKLEQANRVKTQFIENISHDIRTPITGLLGLAQSMYDRAQDDSAREESRSMIDATNQLLSLLNQVIDITQADYNGKEHTTEDFLLNEVINQQFDMLKPAIKDKHLKFSYFISPVVPNCLRGARILFERILLNLLSNAIKFTHKGYVQLDVDLSEQSTATDEPILEIRVKDSGIGIPQDQFEKIFENFTKLHPSYKGVYEGYGLGLYAVKQALERMGGEINVESKLDEGSCFTITLPFKLGNHTNIKSLSKDNVKKLLKPSVKLSTKAVNHPLKTTVHGKLERANLLLIEDQPLAARAVIHLLKGLGCQVTHAHDGEQSLELLEKTNFDLIIADIGLPRMSGLDVAKHIRSQSNSRVAKTPIIALTSHITHTKKNICIEAGMQDMFTKPLTISTAQDILDRYVPLRELSV